MTERRVYVFRCGGYGQTEEALRSVLAQMGGMERFVRPGETILLKPNLLRPAPPETAICTHPAVVAAAARLSSLTAPAALCKRSPPSGICMKRRV